MHDKTSKAPFDPQTAPRPQPVAPVYNLNAPVFNPVAPLYHLDHVLTRVQAAEYLRVSESFFKKKCLTGQGPTAYRCGKRWTYQVRDLVAWRETFRVESQVVALQPAQPAEPAPVTPPPPVQDEALAPPRRGRGRPRKVSLAEREAA